MLTCKTIYRGSMKPCRNFSLFIFFIGFVLFPFYFMLFSCVGSPIPLKSILKILCVLCVDANTCNLDGQEIPHLEKILKSLFNTIVVIGFIFSNASKLILNIDLNKLLLIKLNIPHVKVEINWKLC